MKSASVLAFTMLLIGCGKSKSATKDSTGESPAVRLISKDASASETSIRCERQSFPDKIDIAEASGATLMQDGSLLVIGDSATNGVFLRLRGTDGMVLSAGNLPLDPHASDDLEGLSRIGPVLYGITSSGHMREWQEDGDGFVQTRESYSIAPPGDTENACASAKDSNCGPNYEGLCLVEAASEDPVCAGYVVAKASGKLICLKLKSDGRLSIAPNHFVKVAEPRTLSGCHYDEGGRLWFGNNIFAANGVGFITGHEQPESAVITRLGPLGLGFPEAIAVGEAGVVYRFSDTAGAPSLLDKYICR